MLRCASCGGRMRRSAATRCRCGQPLHDGCEHYHESFDCRDSGERWIGAVEF